MLKIAWSDIYQHPLPNNHRFPMEKYSLLPAQLLHEGTVEKDNFFEPDFLEEKYILSVHKQEYWEKLKNQTLNKSEIRRTGFPLSKQLVEREIMIAEGTRQCAKYALENGIAMNIAGGTHHAFTDRGEGFCLLNDIAIASQYLLDENLVKQILVIDLDVHQGNGTAEVFYQNDNVFTFSMHGAKNYPLHKEKSNLDIDLPDDTNDEEYLTILQQTLLDLKTKLSPNFIFFQSGVDVLKTDKLGRLGMSIQGCRKRDEMVLEYCHKNNIPVVAIMGGGYSPKISDIIEAHANTFRLAQDIYF